MKRLYTNLINTHLKQESQMVFLSGPRQVGKTTAALDIKDHFSQINYFTWDSGNHRQILLQGCDAVANHLKLDDLKNEKPVVIFDEIHKYPDWKNFLKGFFDIYSNKIKIIVTGSSRLDIFKAGGDSLMGRYFLYRMGPLSVAEYLDTSFESTKVISKPKKIPDDIFNNLYTFGGFPEPFLRHDETFLNKWQRLRQQQLFREDIRDLSRIHDVARLEILAELLKSQASQLSNYSNLAKQLRVSTDTVIRWLEVLRSFYYCFSITPWHTNIARSLRKEPKTYLWDWSQVTDDGARYENFIAVHLLKATQFWTDIGLGDYRLHFIRDLEKREIDFIVVKNNQPWFLVEAKSSNNHRINKNLKYFLERTKAQHAFQVVLNMDYVDRNCFEISEPIIVPAKTFLSQLV